MDVSKNKGTPKYHPILIGFSFINHPFWGFSPYFRKPPYIYSIPTVDFSPADSWMTSLALLTEMATKMTCEAREKTWKS